MPLGGIVSHRSLSDLPAGREDRAPGSSKGWTWDTCHTTSWLEARRGWLVREERRLHVEELAVLRVLDERGRVDDALAAKDGTSTRDVRRKRATARNLERQPNVANAAANGDFSQDQLDRVSDLVDPDDPASDEHWAKDGPKWSPQDLADQVRKQRKPTTADAAARRSARLLRYWWNPDAGMLDGRGGLQVHHLWPSSWGGSDDLWNVAAVCTAHHAQLAPQGPLLLMGNPNNPAGLSLIDRDDLPKLADLAATQARAGPEAA